MSKEFFQGVMNSVNPNSPVSTQAATQTSALTPTPTPQGIVVKSGDTLGRLGTKHGFDYNNAQIVRDGKSYNIGNGVGDINPNQIRVGDRVIPNLKTPNQIAIEDAIRAANEQGSERDVEEICQKCTQCELITEEMLRSVWPNGNASRIDILTEGLNLNINDGKIDNEYRITHFIAQARHETGPRLAFRENLNYSEEALFKSGFSYYKGNRARCKRDANNEEAIANNAYADANRPPGYKLGNTDQGDGWRYRGRGLKQITGKSNYKDFTKDHEAIWGDKIDFVANPDLVDQPLYAVRSGLAFWVRKKLYLKADVGVSDEITDSITKVINMGLFNSSKSIQKHVVPRRQNVQKIYKERLFKKVCFNTSKSLSNTKAREPR